MIRDVNSIIGLRLFNSLRKVVLASINYEMLILGPTMKEFDLVVSDNITLYEPKKIGFL